MSDQQPTDAPLASLLRSLKGSFEARDFAGGSTARGPLRPLDECRLLVMHGAEESLGLKLNADANAELDERRALCEADVAYGTACDAAF
jgi:hypothetical protein